MRLLLQQGHTDEGSPTFPYSISIFSNHFLLSFRRQQFVWRIIATSVVLLELLEINHGKHATCRPGEQGPEYEERKEKDHAKETKKTWKNSENDKGKIMITHSY
jgi:hypothetical protein